MIKSTFSKIKFLNTIFKSSPVSLLSFGYLPYGSCISDLYPIFNNYTTQFLAINPISQLISENCDCTHRIYKYSCKGKIISLYRELSSNKFAQTIDINGLDGDCFSHQVIYNRKTLEKIKKQLTENLIFTNRSYSEYIQKDKKDSIGIVHGNYGNVFHFKSLIIPFSRQRRNHCYAPSIPFKADNSYKLVILNPTNKLLKIIINKYSDNLLKESFALDIYKLSWASFDIEGFEGLVSITSKFPMTRPIVIEKNKMGLIDLYHS